MSPAWFLVGVVLCYFQVVESAVYVSGFPGSDDNDESQYYCPAEEYLYMNIPDDLLLYCDEDEDCYGNGGKDPYKCCSAVIIHDPHPGHHTLNRCAPAERKSSRGFCPELLIWNSGFTPFQVQCNHDHECRYDERCCYSGAQKPKFCMTAQDYLPTKFNDKSCPGSNPDNEVISKDCVSGFDCPDQQICCNLKCRDAKSVG